MKAAREVKIPILTYHSIDESGSVVSTGASVFRRQIKFLSEAGYSPVTLKTLGEYLGGRGKLPPKPIALTFDDGFRNFYTTAFPVLSEHNFTATVFLIAGYCGKYNDWSGNSPHAARGKLMDWSEIGELAGNNIEFAAHSVTHPDLTRISADSAKLEIAESKTMIEDKTGREVTAFAYPYGAFDAIVKQMARENYATACATNLGKVKRGDDCFALKRLDAYYLSNESVFRAIVLKEKFDWYLSFRQTMRGVKAAYYGR